MRRHQQPSEVLEQGGDRRFLGVLIMAAPRHLASDHAGVKRRVQFAAHALRMLALGHAVHQQQRQRGGLDGVEPEQENRARNRRHRLAAGDGAIGRGIRQAQDLLRQRDVGQHELGEVVDRLVIRRRQLHHARDRAAERRQVGVLADSLQEQFAGAGLVRVGTSAGNVRAWRFPVKGW